jgi:hypothetical protein
VRGGFVRYGGRSNRWVLTFEPDWKDSAWPHPGPGKIRRYYRGVRVPWLIWAMFS